MEEIRISSKYYPIPYTVQIEPGRTVKVGRKISVTPIYDKGSYKDYKPVLVLKRTPNEYLAEPKRLEEIVEDVDGNATFEITHDTPGTYSYTLRAFSQAQQGQGIQIYVMSKEEWNKMGKLFRGFGRVIHSWAKLAERFGRGQP